MANINYTTLWSDNDEKFDELQKDFIFLKSESEIVKRKPGKIYIDTRTITPHEEIIEFSKKYPNITFFTTYSLEINDWATMYTVKYHIGIHTELKTEPNYYYSFPLEEIINNVPCFESLKQKLINVFKRLDIVKQKEDGEMFVDWVDAKVTATVIHDGFKMTGTKFHHRIDDIKILKERKVIETLWDDVVESIPF